jgi:hypothetical protein
MTKYKYVANTSFADTNISVDLLDGRAFGIGQCVSLTDDEYKELAERLVLIECTCVKDRPDTVKNIVKPVDKTTDKA